MQTKKVTKIDDEIKNLFSAYLAFYKTEKSRIDIEDFMNGNLQNEDVVMLAGTNDGRYVAFSQSYIIPNSLTLGRMAILNDLFVDMQVRGNGFGKTMLDATTDCLTTMGIDRIELSTAVTNVIGQSLYHRNGWLRDDDFLHYFKDLKSGQ